MTCFLPFLSGIIAAVIGISPPGLINLTAVKVSITDGRKRSIVFILGALLIILIQTYISVIFAQYINNHKNVIVLLREIGFGVFSCLSIYFLVFSKSSKSKIVNTEIQLKSKRSRFFMGMLISAINFFPIPYYVLVSITLASYQLFTFDESSIHSLVLGVVFGSFLVFYSYVVFFEKLKSKAEFFIRNTNNILGIITGIIAFLTLINIIDYYIYN